MAKVRRKNLGANGRIDNWKDFIDSFNNPMVVTSKSGTTLYVSINNEITINIGAFDSSFLQVSVTKNGSTSSSVTIWSNNSQLATVTIASSNNLFYIQMRDPGNRRSCIVYEKLSDANLSGYLLYQDMNIPFIDIKNIIISNLDSSISGKHSPILGYTVDVGHLDYLSSDIITSEGLYVATDDNFVATTSLTGDMVYTFNATNYYALGTNTLVEMSAEV